MLACLIDARAPIEHHTVQGEIAMPWYEKGDIRIRYEETGAGFPLLVTPGGGLNSRVSNWPTAVINAMEEFKHDFRCITMDQRNANGGESTGPVPVDHPWEAFADDQLGLIVTGYVKMHENRRFENEVSKKLDEASPASIIIDAGDAQARAVYDSIWPFMRKLLPSMTTISAWCSSRSRMAEVKVLSLLNILGHSLNARFEVSMIEPCS